MISQSTIILTESDIIALLKALIEIKSKTYKENPGSKVKVRLDITKAHTEQNGHGFGYEDYDTSEETTYHEAEFNGATYSIVDKDKIVLEKTLTVKECLENLLSIIYPDKKGEQFDYKLRFGYNYSDDDKLFIHISKSDNINTQVLILKNINLI